MSKPIYKDNTYTPDKRAADLVSKMTIEEKVSQMVYNAKAIERLDVPEYNWWSEALHGVARAGVATVFPQAIGLAAMFDNELMYTVADVISTEGRAKYHEFKRMNDTGIYKGLTFWSPNINIFRDPRWGRGQETFGEDPYLTAETGIAFVNGLQGDDERYLKTAACAKHYAVHSGPEGKRHSFNAVVDKKDLNETYLYAFKRLVEEAKVASIMGAYNRTNNEPCNGSNMLMREKLRGEWGFDGYYLSDCWALKDFHETHMVTSTMTESIALALNMGCDLNCGNLYLHLLAAFEEGLITEETIDISVTRLMKTRILLGMFDDDKDVPFASIPYSVNDNNEHIDLNLTTAQKSMVLLKNNGILPLDKSKVKTIAVIGPNADSTAALSGNYHGTASRYITASDGMFEYLGDDVRIICAEGCHLFRDNIEYISGLLNEPNDRLSEAVSAAKMADVVVMALGLDEFVEGEETDDSNSYGALGNGDKPDLFLPPIQQVLLEKILEQKKPTIVTLFSGSALSLGKYNEKADAIIQAWYPGAQGGKALAQLIFGDYSPSGKLPVTFYKSAADLPDFEEYSMKNRTYRYFNGKPLYPFGYGLSYTKFEYSNFRLSNDEINNGDKITCIIDVKNIGNYDSDEVVTLYIKDNEASVDVPKWSLCGYKRINLKAGGARSVSFTVAPERMSIYDLNGNNRIESGSFTLYCGGSQPDETSEKLTGTKVLSAEFYVK